MLTFLEILENFWNNMAEILKRFIENILKIIIWKYFTNILENFYRNFVVIVKKL